MDEVMKNLWLLLTLVLPGMTTYGTFRILLLFSHSHLDASAFQKIDDSTILTTCFIASVALMQQAIAISIEAAVSAACTRWLREGDAYRLLFCERFNMAASGKLNQDATRIIGYLFTSLNVTVGLGLILAYLLLYERERNRGIVGIVIALTLAGAISAAFRLQSAKGVVSTLEGHATDEGRLGQASTWGTIR